MARTKQKEYGYYLNWNYIIISIVVLAIIMLLVIYWPQMRTIDGNIMHSIRLALSPYPSYIPNFFSTFGRANSMLWPQIAGVSVLISHGKYLKAFLLVFFTNAAFFLAKFMQNGIGRERPGVYDGFTFPSIHAVTTMCFYGILIYLILHYSRSEFLRYTLSAVFGIFIFMVSISRIWLGTNFPSDVIAGLCLGFVLVNLFIIISKALSH